MRTVSFAGLLLLAGCHQVSGVQGGVFEVNTITGAMKMCTVMGYEDKGYTFKCVPVLDEETEAWKVVGEKKK
jgi:hypothetical protein